MCKAENEEMKKYIRKLEKEEVDNCNAASMKKLSDLSKNNKKEDLTLTTRAQKTSWFIEHFGLELDSLQLHDSTGKQFSVSSSPEQGWQAQGKLTTTSQPVTPPATPPSQDTIPISNTDTPIITQQTQGSTPTTLEASTPTRATLVSCPGSQDQLQPLRELKLKLLFLMDKLSVGDAFILELSMVVDGMPRSYLTKQCRDKLNSTCLVQSIPGGQSGAQVSFKDSLINKLKLLASLLTYFIKFSD